MKNRNIIQKLKWIISKKDNSSKKKILWLIEEVEHVYINTSSLSHPHTAPNEWLAKLHKK